MTIVMVALGYPMKEKNLYRKGQEESEFRYSQEKYFFMLQLLYYKYTASKWSLKGETIWIDQNN